MKISVELKIEVLFFIFRKPQKHRFPRGKKGGLAKIVVNFTDSEMCFLAKNVDTRKKILECQKNFCRITRGTER